MTDDSHARRHAFGSLFAVLVIGLAVVPTAPAVAGATTAPKISKASMKDADGDDRADRIQLTYDEPVNHVADSDGTYPFAVAGYQVKKVGAASARTLVVTIKEKTTPDIVAEPAITYTRTSRQPVRNAAGLQAANQTFTGTKRLDLDGDGSTAVGGDCAPKNAAIHPGATDLPDPNFVDTDCDGIDGETDDAAFVASTGAGSACSFAAPCSTPQAGIDAADLGGLRDVYIAGGTYADAAFVVEDGINVFGAFGQNFERGPDATGTTVSIIQGSESDGSNLPAPAGSTVTVVADGLNVPTTIADLTLEGLDATSPGASSYVVHVTSVPGGVLTIERNSIVAGDGADGAAGSSGLDAVTVAAAMDGTLGGDGDEFTTACNDSSHGGGGARGTNSSPDSPSTRDMDGGAGGAGGEMDRDCSFPPEFNATNGDAGMPADYVFGTFGLGGAFGPASSCAAPGDGNPGRIVNGPAGSTISGGSMSDGFWLPRTANAGGTGENGGGGGGGGGTGGCDAGTDSYGAGGGGGGAGGMAARGGGGGGQGGGSSFGIFVIDASPTISGNAFTLGAAGDGGAGGSGGQGQTGGLGGPGGSGEGAPGGGDGGNGAHGGHGGGGAGGAGGRSVGVLSVPGSAPTLSGNTFEGGLAGAGGPGGVSAPAIEGTALDDGNDGPAGTTGTLADTFECFSVTDC